MTYRKNKDKMKKRVSDGIRWGKKVLSLTGTFKGTSESGTWHTALYKDIRKVGRGTWDFIRI